MTSTFLQIVANLLANITAHTPPGTEATISAERVDGVVVLEVSDDGPGVPEGQQPQLFTRFYRGGGSNDARGAGLGLAIVATLVDEHGGSIETRPSTRGLRVLVKIPHA